MSASDHLGPQFFHGTDAQLEPGDVLRPGAEIGKANYDYAEHGLPNDHVFMTTSESAAWTYAKAQTHFHPGAGRVYRVEPTAPAVRKPQPGGWGGQEEYAAPAARVVESRERLVLPPHRSPEERAEHMRLHHPGETSHLQAHSKMVTDHDHH